MFVLLHIFWGICLLLSFKVLLSSNKPIHAIFYLVGCFISISLLLFYLNHEFFALIYMMVYIGAIAVLFLFVIMMLDIKQTVGQKKYKRFSDWWLLWFFFGCFILFSLLLNLNTLLNYTSEVRGWFDIQKLYQTVHWGDKDELLDIYLVGLWLFNSFPELCILVGLILLIAMIGSIILVSDDNNIKGKSFKKVQLYKVQLYRNLLESIEVYSFLNKKK